MTHPQLPWLEGLSLPQLAERIETHYNFECVAGPLKNCIEWLEIKERLKSLANMVPDSRK